MCPFASGKDCVRCFILKQDRDHFVTNLVNHSQDVSKSKIIVHVHNCKIGVKVLSNVTVWVPVSVFPVVVSSLPTFHTGSTEVHEFAREGKSVVSILNKLDNFLARKMRQAGMYQEIAVALVERVG